MIQLLIIFMHNQAFAFRSTLKGSINELIQIVIQKSGFSFASIPAFESACTAPVYTEVLLRHRFHLTQTQGDGFAKDPILESRCV